MNPCPSPLRCLALLGALCFSLAPAARAQDPRGYHGRWNDWNHAPMSLDRGAWRVTVQAVAADDNDFKIASEGWSYEWTHDGFLPLGEVGTAYTSGGNTAIEAVPGRFYSFAMVDVAYGVQGRMIVQETENPPVEIASVDPAVAESNAVVTLATSAAPGPGERLFVRYTFHNWISSAFAEASGSGTNWTAEIPHAPENAGRTCAFYALSTTVAAPAHSDADLQTLRWNDNAGAGYSYAVPGDPPPARLVINEVLSSNDSSEQDEDGDYSDWLEIWNDSAVAVDLDGWGLSDSDASPFKWTFGAVTIQPDEFLVVWASSKNRPAITNGNQLHANFAISAGGEELLLTQPDGTLMDRFEPVAIPTDFSYGRQPDGTGPWKYFTDHTPGAPNSTTGYSAILEPPVYSIPGGFFTTNVEVTLSTSQTGAVVRYTLDGSEPTEASPIFTNAIPLGSKAGISNDLSEIPTNFEPTGPDYYEGWQPPDGEVFKFHVLRTRTFQEGALPSPAVTQSYIIDPAGTNRYTLPVVSIATDAANLFDDDIGIYTPVNDNMLQSGSAWERPGTIEFFEPDGSLAFDGPIGVRLHGNTTRTRPRKALRIYSRGDGPFEYQLFPDKPVAEFDTFILRNGGNDWGNGVIRDLFLQSLAENARLDRQFGRPVLVFLNGEYWGLHDLRDRFDEDYILRHYDLDEDEFVQVEIDYAVSSSYIPIFDEGHELLGSDYSNLWNFVRTHDLIDANHYAAVADRLDLGSFMDFFQANIFFGNTDWPGNNLRAWRSVETNRTENAPAFLDGRWRYMLYDADFGFGLDFVYVPGSSNYVFQPGQTDFGAFAQHDTLAFAANDTSEGAYWSNEPDGTLMFRRLLENDGFRRDFVTRFCDQLNTAYSRAHVTNRWAQWVEILAPEMPEHAARWRQPTNWSYECDRIRSYGEQRTDAVWDHIQDYFDLAAPVDLTVDVANPAAGFVRVNTLDLDADTPGFAGYPWTGAYFTNYPVTLTAVERTGYEFVAWFKDADVFSADPAIELTLTNAAQFEAVFVENLPPQIVAPGLVFQQLVENETPAQFDLDTIFFDPEGAPLTFDAASGDSNIVGVAILDSILSVSPLRRGEADVTVTASDGTTTAGMSFRVLVHPAPHVLQNGAFAFGEWDPELPEKTYPEHMLFLQSDENDPGINTLLRNAYYIAHDDYHADDADKIGFPYKLTGRTRLNGLGADGIAFLNTGRGRDLGGALLALDTRGVSNAPVTWLGGTVLPNSRLYAIRLQYRIGLDDDFADLTDGAGQPVEYLRHDTAGHARPFAPVLLPAEALDQEYVQLLWRYYWTDPEGLTGSRAQLRLDDIRVDNRLAGFSAWQLDQFSPAELADPAVSSPLADPAETGAPNLLRYAYGLSRADEVGPARPSAHVQDSVRLFRHRRLLDPDSGIAYSIESATNLPDHVWTPAQIGLDLFESDAIPTGDGLSETVEYQLSDESLPAPRHLRLNITLTE